MTLLPVFERLRLPVIGAPMFIVSGTDLVIAQCKSGVVGAFPALNARTSEDLQSWIRQVRIALAEHDVAYPSIKAAPFAVNLVVHGGNKRLQDDIEVLVTERVPIVITSLRSPAEVIDRVHSYGGIVLHDVTTVRHARRAIQDGADGLIAVSAGAGGHGGTLSPFALVAEIREFFGGPLALGGAIGNGRAIVAARALGADLAYMGTRFIATAESNADPEYKAMLLQAQAADVVYTPLFSGVHGNYLSASIRRAGLDPDHLPATTTNLNEALGSSAKAWRDIWSAGQGTGTIHDLPPVSSLVDRLHAEYHSALGDLQQQQVS